MAVLARTASARPKQPKTLAERVYETSIEAQGRPGQTLGAVFKDSKQIPIRVSEKFLSP